MNGLITHGLLVGLVALVSMLPSARAEETEKRGKPPGGFNLQVNGDKGVDTALTKKTSKKEKDAQAVGQNESDEKTESAGNLVTTRDSQGVSTISSTKSKKTKKTLSKATQKDQSKKSKKAKSAKKADQIDYRNLEVTWEFCKAILQTYDKEKIRSAYRGNYKKHSKFVEYRTREFGYFKGHGKRKWNKTTPRQNARRTKFFGLNVKLNKRIIPALKCVEKRLKDHCEDGKCTPKDKYPGECQLKHKKNSFPYKPRSLSGIRFRNSFRGMEVSNHCYGIAIDIDPAENTCCKCVARWRNHRLCKRKDLKEPWQRMIMPVCWVVQFERYGFYWLGHDSLEDTMHFEFLGDPGLVDREFEKHFGK
ncbi:MAG: M15 family metallopeptidase [Myxococcota bacterium]|nr:M15 family metallopeptidase [Myxococcota bacterium]